MYNVEIRKILYTILYTLNKYYLFLSLCEIYVYFSLTVSYRILTWPTNTILTTHLLIATYSLGNFGVETSKIIKSL